MMNAGYIAGMIAAASLVTVFIRFLPFFVFAGRKTPPFVDYLGRVLPYAIMGMLVVYCLRETSFMTAPYGTPEICAVALTVLVHIRKRNTLLSILAGTVCYMILIRIL